MAKKEKPNMAMNLFGEMQQVGNVPKKGVYDRRKEFYGYRKSPFGKVKCCATCDNLVRYQAGKVYNKCLLIGNTRSPNTDIKLRNICNKHKSK